MSTSEGGKRRGLRSVKGDQRSGGGPDRSGSRAPGDETATDALLRELLADLQLSRNEIARRAGVGMATVSRHAAKVGRTFDRSQTSAGAEAKLIDARARRAELMVLLIEDAHAERLLREQLSHGAFDRAAARASISRSIGATVRAAVELESAELTRAKLESDERQAAGVDDYLSHLSGEATG